MTLRIIDKIIHGIDTSDGAGVNLKRIIGNPELNMLDPFLLLDEFGSENPKDYISGFPSHPHRGFETITYMLNGKFRHKDSFGNEGILSDGSVQWMTAGKGVIHSEMPKQTKGLVRGFQLWMNLPKKLKMIDPAYNDISAEQIPRINFDGGIIKIIAGKYLEKFLNLFSYHFGKNHIIMLTERLSRRTRYHKISSNVNPIISILLNSDFFYYFPI